MAGRQERIRIRREGKTKAAEANEDSVAPAETIFVSSLAREWNRRGASDMDGQTEGLNKPERMSQSLQSYFLLNELGLELSNYSEVKIGKSRDTRL